MPLVVLLLDRLLALRGRDCLNLFIAIHCERVPAAEGRNWWKIRRRGGNGAVPGVLLAPAIFAFSGGDREQKLTESEPDTKTGSDGSELQRWS